MLTDIRLFMDGKVFTWNFKSTIARSCDCYAYGNSDEFGFSVLEKRDLFDVFPVDVLKDLSGLDLKLLFGKNNKIRSIDCYVGKVQNVININQSRFRFEIDFEDGTRKEFVYADSKREKREFAELIREEIVSSGFSNQVTNRVFSVSGISAAYHALESIHTLMHRIISNNVELEMDEYKLAVSTKAFLIATFEGLRFIGGPHYKLWNCMVVMGFDRSKIPHSLSVMKKLINAGCILSKHLDIKLILDNIEWLK